MGYSAGFLNHRVLIRNKKSPTEQTFGETTEYEDAGCVWANVTWSKGVKALHEGALDAYDTVLIRMRWNKLVRRDSQLVYDGVTYQIQSFHADRQDNTIQITATEIVK
jgi:SPP1 family predicted phage head-tail adaptor